MVTGGTEAAITPMGIRGFANMRALSTRNDDPPEASRPFDRDRDGFVLSEGAGMLVFEELEHAKARGAHDLRRSARLRRRAPTPATSPQPDEDGRGAIACDDRRAARRQAATRRRSTTSTPTAPARRWATRPRRIAIKTVFGEHARKLSISSTKSQLGHLLGASGGVELSSASLALRRQRHPADDQPRRIPIPTAIWITRPNAPAKPRVNRVMTNSFGFGGHNASLVLGRYDGRVG